MINGFPSVNAILSKYTHLRRVIGKIPRNIIKQCVSAMAATLFCSICHCRSGFMRKAFFAGGGQKERRAQLNKLTGRHIQDLEQAEMA